MTDIVDRLNNCGPCYYESSLRRDVEVERCVADAAVEITNLRARVAELEAEKAASWRAERDRFYKGLVRQAESLAAMAQRLGGEAEERGERNKHENALLTVVKENKELRDRVAELERENQTQRDMMQGKDDAIAELSFTVRELEAQVAARDADAKERQP